MITKQILKNTSKKELVKALSLACSVDKTPLEYLLEAKGFKLKHEDDTTITVTTPDGSTVNSGPSPATDGPTDGTPSDNVLSDSDSTEAGVQVEGSSPSGS